MSKRGADFFQKWLTNNIPASGLVDPNTLSVAELTQKLFADAKALGITDREIEGQSGSAYEVILHTLLPGSGQAD